MVRVLSAARLPADVVRTGTARIQFLSARGAPAALRASPPDDVINDVTHFRAYQAAAAGQRLAAAGAAIVRRRFRVVSADDVSDVTRRPVFVRLIYLICLAKIRARLYVNCD